MGTAVVDGSIQRAATSISAASDQSSTTPMISQRINDRRNPVRTGVCVIVFVAAGVAPVGAALAGFVMSVSGMAVTSQNNIPRWVAAAGRSSAGEDRMLRRARTVVEASKVPARNRD